jgi:prepilin-type N-terminal cleavage/methylation domain-containing protein
MKKSGTQKINGFTIIELLVVVAIFVILVTIVIVSLREASDRGRNTKIATNVVQIKKVAEDIAIQQPSGYLELCDNDGDLNVSETNIWNDTLRILKEDIIKYGGTDINCYALQDAYCVSVRLVGSQLKHLCIDSEGNIMDDAGPCTDANPCQ